MIKKCDVDAVPEHMMKQDEQGLLSMSRDINVMGLDVEKKKMFEN